MHTIMALGFLFALAMPLQVRNLMQVDEIVAGKCCGDAFNCWLEIDNRSMGSCPGKSVLYNNFVWLGDLIRTLL